MSAKTEQVGGDHYKSMAIQPAEFIHRNGIGYMEGCAIKYLCRHKRKNGREDLEKAIHFIRLLIDEEYPKVVEVPSPKPEPCGTRGVGDGYRPLDARETVQAGDELHSTLFNHWSTITLEDLSRTPHGLRAGDFTCAVRRKITQTPA